MNSIHQLPAVLLPNSNNAQDTTAIFRDGAKKTVTDLLKIVEAGSDLRFMVQASDPRTSEAPRITWHAQGNGTVVAAAAFVSGSDMHGRIASAALVYELSESTILLSKIPPGLPSDQLQNLTVALQTMNPHLLLHIEAQRQLGKVGGEYRFEKKKPEPHAHGSHRHF